MIVPANPQLRPATKTPCNCGGKCGQHQGLGLAWPDLSLPSLNLQQFNLPQLDWKLLALLAVGGYLAWRILFSGRSSERRKKLLAARKRYTDERRRIYQSLPVI